MPSLCLLLSLAALSPVGSVHLGVLSPRAVRLHAPASRCVMCDEGELLDSVEDVAECEGRVVTELVDVNGEPLPDRFM